MKKQIIRGLIVALLGLAFLSIVDQVAKADYEVNSHGPAAGQFHLLAAATPLPTAENIPSSSPTPEARVLPPIGRNAGVVIGAGVLVLIILIGVLSSRLRSKH